MAGGPDQAGRQASLVENSESYLQWGPQFPHQVSAHLLLPTYQWLQVQAWQQTRQTGHIGPALLQFSENLPSLTKPQISPWA